MLRSSEQCSNRSGSHEITDAHVDLGRGPPEGRKNRPEERFTPVVGYVLWWTEHRHQFLGMEETWTTGSNALGKTDFLLRLIDG